MERIPRAIYTKELRRRSGKLVTEGELSMPEVGRRLSIATSTIRYWVKASREGKLQECRETTETAYRGRNGTCPGQTNWLRSRWSETY